MQEILNSRELSVLTWIGVVLLLMMFKASYRRSLNSVLKAAFQKKLMIVYTLMLICISLEVFILFKVMCSQ
jgi:hypothetical protein